MEAAAEAAFVLVAGGLGERLGYSGIKLALPVDSARGACFLQVGVDLLTHAVNTSDMTYRCLPFDSSHERVRQKLLLEFDI